MTDVVAVQQAALDRLYRTHVGAGDRYALLDFPDHANVGDSAIWLGEMAMLRRITGRDPCYISCWHDFDEAAFRAACPDGIVFLHGGGNLGDIWPHHQRFREGVVRALHDYRLVQLPQSIHFDDPVAAYRFADLADVHPDLTLYVRDRPSLAIATTWLGDRTLLAPDSAFALGTQPRRAPTVETLALMRSDSERRDHVSIVPADAEVVDWLHDDAAIGGTDFASRQRQADARLQRGLALLSRGRMIVTDRLHGHILALLLDIPHRVLDNRYGKVGAYIDAWTSGSPLLLREPLPA
ncbi:pyruvyl transferase EpsO [Sphingomonas jinjuensis]|uniref:Pyruvyl transferase EpsO n=1 Tax=Sphingomonas jinjuensis TaxID=535907 RepID=A0A840F6H3_9SPHN|nr:polysaccharide pyruvyl transferase family protein [Sphingomonas jinjuensis]MBB4154873.1 pyruvyl transferase EpsO [Sphingomonas jinjuensis]